MIDRTTLTIRVRNVSGRTSNLFSTSHIKSDATNENVLNLAEAIQALQSVSTDAGEQEVLKSTQYYVYSN